MGSKLDSSSTAVLVCELERNPVKNAFMSWLYQTSKYLSHYILSQALCMYAYLYLC